MARHVILLVHGAGSYTKNGKPNTQAAWFKEAKASVKAAFESHAFLKNEKFETWFDFEEIIYDDFFHDLIKSWDDRADVFSPIFKGNPLASTIFDFFKGSANTENNFLWANAADVFLYAAFGSASKLVRPTIISKVRSQFTAAMIKHAGKRWSVMAHSLGTAVAHDVLSLMQVSADMKLYSSPTVVAMIANLSKVLESQQFGGDVYTSPVRPDVAVNNYISALHAWDPVAAFKQFNPPSTLPGWRHENNTSRNRYFEKLHGLDHFVLGAGDTLSSTLGFNPITHKFSHYMADPKVHLTFFKLAEPRLEITDEQIGGAIDAFRARQNIELKEFVKARLNDISVGGAQAADLGDYLDILKLIYKRWS